MGSNALVDATAEFTQRITYLLPFRQALHEIKRRLFFADFLWFLKFDRRYWQTLNCNFAYYVASSDDVAVSPSGRGFVLSLLGYSFINSNGSDYNQIDKTLNKINNLLLLTKSLSDNQMEIDEDYSVYTLDDYELGCLIGHGCLNNLEETNTEILSQSSNSLKSLRDDQLLDDNDENLKEVRYCASVNLKSNSGNFDSPILPEGHFNLAIKMMFNYGVQSNSASLLKVMDRELLPLKEVQHPNIVRIYSYFVDNFPLLPEAYQYYPMAIPSKYGPDGYGRNKTLFIVMKRYDMTITEYLREKDPSIGDRLLLMSQMFEALLYLNQQSLVHRDLKSDNILVCSETGELVLADFGCALKCTSLLIPYVTDETAKGGNLALMAPEILLCQPGPSSYLDYRKSDLWSSGTICYELFDETNPFFSGHLRNDTYTDKQLPEIQNVPLIIEKIIHSVLRKNHKQVCTTSTFK
ncbi:unnamed protein product [Didymodactylos carnosus]|uniref:non-specific serine/threonine protein kinase n=1 Tax=Didymodactylos carnosus TaxID=1234261 RepID=A0A814QH66_9BILA|nr:unnamed protein product [Didymodactylos carnosus]CAF3882960.1 unnamed protein product [Didymodactylos carnosus]